MQSEEFTLRYLLEHLREARAPSQEELRKLTVAEVLEGLAEEARKEDGPVLGGPSPQLAPELAEKA